MPKELFIIIKPHFLSATMTIEVYFFNSNTRSLKDISNQLKDQQTH